MALLLDLIDQRQVFVTFAILDLIDADRSDQSQLPVLEPQLHDILDQVLGNDGALSCQDSFLAQCARNHVSTLVSWCLPIPRGTAGTRTPQARQVTGRHK